MSKIFYAMPADEKKEFLKLLKENPEQVARAISHNLVDWGTIATMETRDIIFIHDIDADSGELVEHLKEHYKTDLAALAA